MRYNIRLLGSGADWETGDQEFMRMIEERYHTGMLTTVGMSLLNLHIMMILIELRETQVMNVIFGA